MKRSLFFILAMTMTASVSAWAKAPKVKADVNTSSEDSSLAQVDCSKLTTERLRSEVRGQGNSGRMATKDKNAPGVL